MTVIRVATANTFDATVNRITQRSAELALTQERLASGKRVLRATDDPVAATLAERESNRLMRTEADLRALERSRSSLQQAESTIGQMGEVLIRFKELLVQGGNASLSASDRRSVALEMRGLRDQLLNLANTQDTEGNALLAGLGPTNFSGRPFVDVFPGGVQFQALAGQAAATEVALPGRVNGDFALMRLPSGDGLFEIGHGNGQVLVSGITVRDRDALNATGFFNQPPANVDFSLRVTWNELEGLNLEVLRSDAVAPLRTIPLGNPQSGEVVNIRQALGASSVAFRDEVTTPNLEYGFEVQLDGIVSMPDPLPSSSLTLARVELRSSQPSGDLFSTLQRAIDTLENTNLNSTGRTQELGRVHQEMQTGQDRLLLVRGRLGELLRRADSIEGLLQDRSVAGQRELSNLTDLDMVKGISEFQTQQLGLQAALQSYAQVQRLSLFQFIA